MATANKSFAAGFNGTWVVPTTIAGGVLTATIVGGRGGGYGGGYGGRVDCVIPVSPGDTMTVQVANGRIGFHNGGNGTDPSLTGYDGGGSTAVKRNGTLYVEAGGGGGGVGAADGGPEGGEITGGYGGGLGTPAGGPGIDARNGGTAGAGGIAGGTGANGVDGHGAEGGSGGGAGAGPGGGGTGFMGAFFEASGSGGGGASFASNLLSGTPKFSWDTSPYVVFTYTITTAPATPALDLPANSGYADAQNTAINYTGTYNTVSGTGVLEKVAMGVSLGGAPFGYWDPGAGNFNSTTPVWFVPTTGAGAVNGGLFTVQVPAGKISNGQTVVWTMACQEGTQHLQGQFANPVAYQAVVIPTAAITTPSGNIDSIAPQVTWTAVFSGADIQTTAHIKVVSAAQYSGAGFSWDFVTNPVYDSTAITQTLQSLPIPSTAGLINGTSYVVGLQIGQTGGSLSTWVTSTFTVALIGPADPSVIAFASNDPTTGMPVGQITVIQNDNVFTATDDGSSAAFLTLLTPNVHGATDKIFSAVSTFTTTAVPALVAGDVVLIAVETATTGPTVSTIAAHTGAAGTWTKRESVKDVSNVVGNIEIWEGRLMTAGTTQFDVTLSGAGTGHAQVVSAANLQPGGSFDTSVGSATPTTSTFIGPGNLTPTSPGDLLFWAMHTTAGAGTTSTALFATDVVGSTGAGFDAAYAVGVGVAISGTGWNQLSAAWLGCGACFQAAPVLPTTNTILDKVASPAADGTFAVSAKAIAMSAMSFDLTALAPVTPSQPYSLMANFQGPVARTVTFNAVWTDAVGSTVHTDTVTVAAATGSTNWHQALIQVTSPSNAAQVKVTASIAAAVANETYFVQNVSALTGTTSSWSPGGLTNAVTAHVQASFDGGSTWFEIGAGTDFSLQQLPVTSGEAIGYDEWAAFGIPIQYQARLEANFSGQIIVSDWVGPFTITLPATQWWVMIAQDPSFAVGLHRTVSTTGGSAPSGLTDSLTIDQPEEAGRFQAFGRSTAIVVHGDLLAEEFDISLLFFSDTEWDDFVAIRNQQSTLLLKSDMSGDTYYMTFGASRQATIIQGSDRFNNSTRMRALTIHCIPVDAP